MNSVNSCHIKTKEFRKLKKYHTKLAPENGQGDLSTLHSRFGRFTKKKN